MKNYLFQTERLGIRNWMEADIPTFVEMGKNKRVMKYFPILLSEQQSVDFMDRMRKQFEKKGYAYLPVDVSENGEFIGMIGIMDQNYGNYLHDFVDIGWRLKETAWGKGFATEGAKGWLKYGFEKNGFEKIYVVAPLLNLGSEKVMKKIGMKKSDELEHPKISKDSPLCKCGLYSVEKTHYFKIK